MLESLETVFGKDSILTKIRQLIAQFKYRNFDFGSFLSLLQTDIVDSIDLAQVSL